MGGADPDGGTPPGGYPVNRSTWAEIVIIVASITLVLLGIWAFLYDH